MNYSAKRLFTPSEKRVYCGTSAILHSFSRYTEMESRNNYRGVPYMK